MSGETELPPKERLLLVGPIATVVAFSAVGFLFFEGRTQLLTILAGFGLAVVEYLFIEQLYRWKAE